MKWDPTSKVWSWLAIPALVSILLTISVMGVDQRITLLVVVSCMLGVVPVLLFHMHRREAQERELAERAFREREAQYRRLLDLRPMAVVRKGRIQSVNEAWSKLVGAPAPDEFVGKRLAECFVQHPDSDENALLRSDGTLVAVRVTTIPDADDTQHIIAQDISDRRKAELEARKAHQIAERAEAAKSEFLTSISHEVRTPLNAILGMSGLLMDTRLDERQCEYASTLRDSAGELLSRLNNALELAQLEAGRVLLETHIFDLEQLLEEMIELVSFDAKSKRIAVALLYGPSVPRSVQGDPGRVRQVVFNILSNALRFTAQGRIVITVEEDLRTEDQTLLRISISDTGVGMPADRLEHLFDRGGAGFGLAISKRLVELMNGTIGAASKPGMGSTFHFRVPLRVCPPQSPAPRLAAKALVADAALFQGRRVLLVDDNTANQMLGVRLLERFGCRVDVAGNGQEAVAMADRLPYDLIFMDCQMPDMDGYEATEEIRRREVGRRRVPIFAMTANGDKQKCLDAGMDDYIAKPVRIEDVRNLLTILVAAC